MADYIFKTINFVDNQGGTLAENVTSSIVNLYHQIPLIGDSNDGNLVLNRNNVYNEYRTPWSSSIMEQPFFVNYDWTQNENLDMNFKYLQVVGNAFNDFGGTVFNVAVYDMMPSGCLRVINGNTY